MTIQAHYRIQSVFAERLRWPWKPAPSHKLDWLNCWKSAHGNYQLRQPYQQCGSLPDEDQQALVVMMDSLVKKPDVTRVIGKMAYG